jgi:puromycin-sensitive aminopeptidase
MHVRAMENWGAIAFVDYAILSDFQNSPLDLIHRSARTICHEIAHMWFGNLVTMEWWTQIWLNEGFARFMEHIAVDKFLPHFNIWEKFYEQVYSQALKFDSRTTHPVEITCGSPAEVNQKKSKLNYLASKNFRYNKLCKRSFNSKNAVGLCRI